MDITIQKEENCWRVLLKEQFTFSDNARFRDFLEAIKAAPPAKLVLDMSDLDYVDSAALGMLLLLRDTLMPNNTHITLKGAKDQVKKILELSRFDDLFTLE